MKNFKQKSIEPDPLRAPFKAPPVTEYMTRKLITFSPDSLITEVIDSLLEHRISGAPVINSKNQVVGLIDDRDCLKVLIETAYHNQPATPQSKVSHYMSNVMKSISDKDNIVDVANIFLQTKFKRLLVMDEDKKLVGQISRRDVLRAIKDMNDNF